MPTGPNQRPVPRPSQRARRLLFRHRRLLAAFLFCLAAALTVESLVPPEQRRVPVVVAAVDLPVGTVLAEGQLATRQLLQEALPSGAFSSATALVGEQLATPLSEGDVVAPTFLLGTGLLTGAPAGTVAVPVRPSDPSTVQLLEPGQHVDVVLSTGNGFEIPVENTVLARGVPVLWSSASGESGTTAWPGADQPEGLVAVAADPADAAALAGASSSGQVHLVLTNPPP